MIDWTKPIETRDGRGARNIYNMRGDSPLRRVIIVDYGSWEALYHVDDNGTRDCGDYPFIRNVPPSKRKVWVAISVVSVNVIPIRFETRVAAEKYISIQYSNRDNWFIGGIEIDGSL